MKTITLITAKNLTCCLAGLAIAGMLLVPTLSSAQEKGATKLMKLNAIKTVADAEAVQPGDTVVMSCPKCKDSWVTIVTPPAKTGSKPETTTVARHDCPGCEHKYVTEGHGKAKTDKLVHVCKKCGSEDAFCCVMKKGTGPTAGMEKK
jgi:DNA-directed RNA polymerase subunit M/transcription elongation factor TFIIS